MRFELAEWAINAAKMLFAISTVLYILLIPFCLLSWPLWWLRKAAGRSAILTSYVAGITLWVASFGYVLLFWGWLGIIIGLLVLGVGVFPEALIVLATKGQWGLIGLMILHFIAILVMRMVGALALGSYQRHREALALSRQTDISGSVSAAP